jgi:hypothetical protein
VRSRGSAAADGVTWVMGALRKLAPILAEGPGGV